MRKSVFSKIFFGRPKTIPHFKWLGFLILEAYLGEQLLDMISSTSSYNEGDQYFITKQVDFGDKINGWCKPLIDFIPSTLFNKILKNKILKLLRYKYVEHYQLLTKRVENDVDQEYGLNHDSIHLLTELKLGYNTIWVTINIIVDIIVYWYSTDISLTVAVGGFIEFLRRFKW